MKCKRKIKMDISKIKMDISKLNKTYKNCIVKILSKKRIILPPITEPGNYTLGNKIYKVTEKEIDQYNQIIKEINNTDLISNGTGFFYVYKGKVYIICSAHTIFDRTIYDDNKDICIGIENVNNTGENVIEDIRIVGVDGISDIAICECKNLIIDPNKIPNLKFLDSRNILSGETCWSCGMVESGNTRNVITGVVCDNVHLDQEGYFMNEGITTTLRNTSGGSGSPIFDRYGNLIGIVNSVRLSDSTNDQLIGFTYGLSSRAMIPIVKNILSGKQCEYVKNKTYYRVRKPDLGLMKINMQTLQESQTYKVLTAKKLYEKYYKYRETLKLLGIIVNYLDKDSVLCNAIKGKNIQKGDIITGIEKYNKDKNKQRDIEYIPIGYNNGQYSLYSALYDYDPKKNPIVSIKFIRIENDIINEYTSSFLLNKDYVFEHIAESIIYSNIVSLNDFFNAIVTVAYPLASVVAIGVTLGAAAPFIGGLTLGLVEYTDIESVFSNKYQWF